MEGAAKHRVVEVFQVLHVISDSFYQQVLPFNSKCVDDHSVADYLLWKVHRPVRLRFQEHRVVHCFVKLHKPNHAVVELLCGSGDFEQAHLREQQIVLRCVPAGLSFEADLHESGKPLAEQCAKRRY